MEEKPLFSTVFSKCPLPPEQAAALAGARVLSANVDARARTLTAVLDGPEELAGLLPRLETALCAAYGLRGARLTLAPAEEPVEEVPPPPVDADAPPPAESGPPWEEPPGRAETAELPHEPNREPPLKQPKQD
ncbi:MAG: hypothetical protein LUD69_02860, partial [Oscillospiraceae bacterium]|nr:hypothetical protein [Oscillospiraceae bacterium]